MKKILQAAGVASLVLFGAVGCSTCCPWTSKSSSCANGHCPPGTPTTTSHAAPGGMVGTAMPTTMTTMPGRSPMMSVNTMPASGAPVGTGSPALIPQQ